MSILSHMNPIRILTSNLSDTSSMRTSHVMLEVFSYSEGNLNSYFRSMTNIGAEKTA
jgi:hypothetical protein